MSALTKKRGPKPGAKPLKTAKRDAILKAARTVFSSYPYQSASMRMIAVEAGIDHPLINYYFPNKASLFEAVISEVIEELSMVMPKWFDGIRGLSLADALAGYYDQAIEYYRKNPAIMRVILLNMTQSVRNPGHIPGYKTIQKAFDLGAALMKGRSRFQIERDQMVKLSKGISLMITSLMGAREYHAETLGMDPDSDQYFNWVKEELVFMIKPVLNTLEQKDAH